MSDVHYQTFPGTSGFYASRADTNLLDADTAHIQQSVGLWASGSGGSLVLTQSTDGAPLFGDYTLKCVSSGATGTRYVNGGVLGASGVSVSPSTGYAFGFDHQYVGSGASIHSVRFYWMDAAFANLSNTVGAMSGDSLSASRGRTVVAATSPALAAYVLVQVRFDDVNDTEILYLDQFCLAEGSDASFVPSLRIVGDLDMRANLSPDSVTTYQRILNTEDGSDGYSLLLASTSGEVYVANGDGSTNRSGTSSGMGLAVGQASEVRVTYDISAGTITYYKDDVSVDTDSCTVAASSPSGEPLNVGTSNGTAQMLDADLYWVEVRDGIDGPVAARWDAADAWTQAT